MRGALKVKLQNVVNPALILGSGEDRGIFIGGRRRNRKRRRNRNGKDKTKSKKGNGKESPVLTPKDDKKPLIETDFSDSFSYDSNHDSNEADDELPALVHSSSTIATRLCVKDADLNNNVDASMKTEEDDPPRSRDERVSSTESTEGSLASEDTEGESTWNDDEQQIVENEDEDSDVFSNVDLHEEEECQTTSVSLSEELRRAEDTEETRDEDLLGRHEETEAENQTEAEEDIVGRREAGGPEELESKTLTKTDDEEEDMVNVIDDDDDEDDEEVMFSKKSLFGGKVITSQPSIQEIMCEDSKELSPLICKEIDPNCLCCVIL